jgi:hypothetical protein
MQWCDNGDAKVFTISDITMPFIIAKTKLERCNVNTLDVSEARVSASRRLPLFKVDHGNKEEPAQQTVVLANAPKSGTCAAVFTSAMMAAEGIDYEVTVNVSSGRNFILRNGICSCFFSSRLCSLPKAREQSRTQH